MPENKSSKVSLLNREITYNAEVFRLLSERAIPYLVWYGSDGRTIEAKTPIKGLALLFKTAPMPEGKVLLIIKPTGLKPFVEEIDDRLLVQRLHSYVRKVLP